MEISVQTFSQICRICLIESSDMKSLFSKMDGEERSLFEILAFTADVHVKLEDSLPKQVCGECESVMCKADAFKRRCLDSETILNNLYCNSVYNGETSNFAQNCSIKDEKSDIKQKLSNYSNFQPSNITYSGLQDSFDKKNVALSEDVRCSTPASSFSRFNHLEVPVITEIQEQSVKEETAWSESGLRGGLHFEEETDFSDHYNEGTQFDTTDYKEEKSVKIEENTTCYCGSSFSNEDEYKSHLKKKKCDKLRRVLKKKDKVGLDIQIKCGECNQKFNTSKECKDHLQTHHNKNIPDKEAISHVCKFCLCQFKTASSLASHIRKHEKTANDKIELYQCSFCLHKFKKKTSLTAHIKRHEISDKIRHICKICKREFKYKAYLENHIITMHPNKTGMSCELCAESFPNEESLKQHKNSHDNVKKHQCPICNKAFLMSCTLKEHFRTHTGEKPFLCSQCGKGFSQKNNMMQHMRRHQGLKPFKCESCEKRFVSKGELDAHTRKHSGAHPFVCSDCGNGFTTSSALVKHRRIHTGEKPYLCDLCPMKFAASGTLKNHRRTHTGERPFQCSHCEKAFVQRNDLISHIRCHTGEKPYICTQCGQSFRKGSGLKTHIKMHVKEPVNMMQGVLLNGMQCAEQ